MKINAVVVTYNRKELLLECVNAILEQTLPINKLFIIDNNSNDGTFELLKKKGIINNKVVNYTKLEKNIGGSGGFYSGMKLAYNDSCDWVWIMDDDTIPTKDCLEELVKSLKILKNEKISFLASTIYGPHGEPMNLPGLNTDAENNYYSDCYKYLGNGIVKIKQATFVSLLINFKAIEKCGYPIKDYFIWGDDSEYTLRLNKYYGNAYFVGKSVAIHKIQVSKELSLFEENNPNRIKLYYYMIRNNLINRKEYSDFYRTMYTLMKNQIESFHILFSLKSKNRFKKFGVIHKGILAFIFHRYDYKAFKNRLDVNVEYKN